VGTKKNPGKFDCYGKADPDEPMFVLLGRDPVASVVVRVWAELRSTLGKTEAAVLDEALSCADALGRWAYSKGKFEQINAAHDAFKNTIYARNLRAGGIRPISMQVIDEHAAEAAKLGHQDLAVHYACALANWNLALDERDALKNRVQHLERSLKHIAQTCVDDPDAAQFASRAADDPPSALPPEVSK
jgi:hypothetical protein